MERLAREARLEWYSIALPPPETIVGVILLMPLPPATVAVAIRICLAA